MTVEEEKKQDAHVMYLVVRESLGMSPGKVAAQCGHAVMQLCDIKTKMDWKYTNDGLLLAKVINARVGSIYDYEIEELKKMQAWNTWHDNCRKVVLRANETQWRQLKKIADVLVVDAGYTEIAPNSETILGFWPVLKSQAPGGIKRLQIY